MPPLTKKPDAPENILKRLITMIDELAAVMSEEEKLIETRNAAQHAELLKRKQRLTIDYRSSMKVIEAQPDMLKITSSDLRQKARTASRKLAEMTERNARFLRGAIIASEQLAQSVVQAIKDEYLPKNSYVNPHQAMFALGSYSPSCKPITVNRTA